MLADLDLLRWKRAIVTGATGGLGAAVVARLTEICAKALATARSGPQPADWERRLGSVVSPSFVRGELLFVAGRRCHGSRLRSHGRCGP
jgi:NAD(P)-dependent dehydrogenase (short-subunit alcohol dehydrogenase family)